MSSRQAIRKEKRRQRQSLTLKQQLSAMQGLDRQLMATSVYRRARRVAAYWVNDGEIDLSYVMARMQRMKKHCYLPVLDTLGSKRLWFAPVDSQTRFHLNKYGIPEPQVSPREYIRASQLDLILLPLVAFDRDGHRLGMGGGFYDRTLAYLKRRHCWHKPYLYGVAYEFQCVDHLEAASWDVPLQFIVTDQYSYRVCV